MNLLLSGTPCLVLTLGQVHGVIRMLQQGLGRLAIGRKIGRPYAEGAIEAVTIAQGDGFGHAERPEAQDDRR